MLTNLSRYTLRDNLVDNVYFPSLLEMTLQQSPGNLQQSLNNIAHEMNNRMQLGYGLGRGLRPLFETKTESEKIPDQASNSIITSIYESASSFFQVVYERVLDQRFGNTQLHRAIANQTVENIPLETLRENLGVVDRNGNLPIHLSIEKNNLKALVLLLENGADPNQPNSRRFTPLHLAVFHSNLEAAKILLAQGANLKTNHGVLRPAFYFTNKR